MTARGGPDDGGGAILLVGVVLAVAAGLGVLVVDLTAYLLAAGRAQAAADAAARAAVAITDPRGRVDGDALADATTIVNAHGADLRSCDCGDGTDRVTVEVAVLVPGLVVPRFAAREVTATSAARLAPP